jgi:hypothetical protein
LKTDGEHKPRWESRLSAGIVKAARTATAVCLDATPIGKGHSGPPRNRPSARTCPHQEPGKCEKRRIAVIGCDWLFAAEPGILSLPGKSPSATPDSGAERHSQDAPDTMASDHRRLIIQKRPNFPLGRSIRRMRVSRQIAAVAAAGLCRDKLIHPTPSCFYII